MTDPTDSTEAAAPDPEATENKDNAGQEDPKPRVRAKRLFWSVVSVVVLGLAGGLVTWLMNNVHRYDFVVNADTDAITSRNFAGGEYLFQKPIEQVSAAPDGQDTCLGRYRWAHGQEAVDANSTNAQVTVSAADGHSVQVIGARAVPVGGPQPPLLGSVVTCPGRGAESKHLLQLDLDSGKALFFPDGDQTEPGELNVPVEGGKTAVFDLTAGTNAHSWTYDLEFDLRVDGKEVKEKVTNNGDHFRTSAPNNSKIYRWLEGRWTDASPGAPQQSTPAPVLPPGTRSACDLVAASDVSSIMGEPYKQSLAIPAQWAKSEGGFPVVASNCSFAASDLSTVQIALTDALAVDNGRKEYAITLGHVDPDQKAPDLQNYTDVKVVDNNTLVALHGSKVVMIFVDRTSNRVQPFDEDKLKTLLDQVSLRLT